jgi:hypothetical protein
VTDVSFVSQPYDKACRVMNAGGVDPLTGEPPPDRGKLTDEALVARTSRTRAKKRRKARRR